MRSAKSPSAAPIEIAPAGFPILRGLGWGTEPSILLLHAPGGDLDDWRDLPALLALRTGAGTQSFDLPGHGLSEDPLCPSLEPLLAALLQTEAMGGVRIVVAAGETAVAALRVADTVSLTGVVAFSPLGHDVQRPGAPALPRSPRVAKLFLTTGQPSGDADRCRQLAQAVGGWAMVVALGGPSAVAALLDGPRGAQIRDTVAGFARERLLRTRLG
jgi:pimeloyl-ACP methyl ester carboxylesterase